MRLHRVAYICLLAAGSAWAQAETSGVDGGVVGPSVGPSVAEVQSLSTGLEALARRLSAIPDGGIPIEQVDEEVMAHQKLLDRVAQLPPALLKEIASDPWRFGFG